MSEAHQQALHMQHKTSETAVAECMDKVREFAAKYLLRFAMEKAILQTRHAFAVWRDDVDEQFMQDQEMVTFVEFAMGWFDW